MISLESMAFSAYGQVRTVACLDGMDGAAFGEMTGIKMETVDGEFGTLKQVVAGQKLRDPFNGWIFQSGQGDMGREFSFFRYQAAVSKLSVNAIFQFGQLGNR